jgi:hypothetical protein
MQRDRGQCFIQVEAAVLDRMRAMRRPGDSYSQVILRLAELETGPPQTVLPRTPIAAAGNVSKGADSGSRPNVCFRRAKAKAFPTPTGPRAIRCHSFRFTARSPPRICSCARG